MPPRRAAVDLLSLLAASAASLDIADFWSGRAHWEFVSKARFTGRDGQYAMNVGIFIVPSAFPGTGLGTWYLFHREYGFGRAPGGVSSAGAARQVKLGLAAARRVERFLAGNGFAATDLTSRECHRR